MQLFKKFFLSTPDFAASERPVLGLLATELPRFPLQNLVDELAEITGIPQSRIQLNVEKDWAKEDLLLVELVFGEHRVEIAGIGSPVPSIVMERCVATAHWGGAFRKHMARQKANLILAYAGVSMDAIAQHLALYQVAAAIAEADEHGDLLGVVNEPSWTSHPLDVIGKVLDPEMAEIVRTSPPLIFWTGLVGLDSEGDMWLMSRGHHLFNVPDFAWHAKSSAEAQEVQDLFGDLFHYVYFEKHSFQPGDFLYLDGTGYLTFLEGDELKELFGAAGDLLVVRRSSAEEIAIIEAEHAEQQLKGGN